MKKGALLALLAVCWISSFAGHIAGGEVYYRLLGPGTNPNTNRYEITLRLFRECNPPIGGQPTADLPVNVILSIFNNTNPASAFLISINVPRTSFQQLTKSPNPCISGDREVCYQMGLFVTVQELPVNSAGYVVAFQTCCRTNNILNLAGNGQGATYTANIPGNLIIVDAINSSPQFAVKDTTLVCRNSPFTLDFSATDADGDSLIYTFCPAFDGGDKTNATNAPATAPPYGNLIYNAAFPGISPLGPNVTINRFTGIISGVAPATPGSYVINVCIAEFRNGVQISTHRKDFTLRIGDCTLAAAELQPSYITCSGFDFTFQNESSASGITSYTWNFGDPASGLNNVSNLPTPTHTFSDTGRFVVKLIVANNAGCRDSAQTIMSVFPNFKADFNVIGNCFQSPFQFLDATTSSFGVINSWRWDFGVPNLTNDTSILRNPTFLYPGAGIRNVRLIATNTKGCSDTITKPVTVRENPVLVLPFKDTLICSIDQLPLQAQGTGNFSWVAQPADPSLTTPNIPNPVVAPKDTTLYIVTLNENGCIKSDTITVNVLDFITVDLGRDTGICRTDTIIMNTRSHALSYQWSPAAGLSSTTEKFPKVFPDTTTTYYVQANLGLCPAFDTITIQVAPYPIANAGNDVTICFGESTQLSGNYVGTGFAWSPPGNLRNANTLTPIASPPQTTAYVLTAFSQGICPKPWSDTAWVFVRPRVNAFAGNDTLVTALQPLQLNATGGVTYSWTPPFGLSATNISNPVATLPATVDSIIYRVRAFDSAGCFSDDEMKVVVFKTGPEIFIPTAFTPNADGRNDIAMPVLVGMRQLNYFRIYNRWGQMIYSTSQIGKGWDGTLGGTPQPSGTYVFAAQAVDYTGKVVMKKGTIVLIR